ncbi:MULTISPECIES: competence type IV pilus ATPase ComGA [unclassified Bacillus (in: firmicutes)]|uniref:competence type IV pilus ATPase ComGA n=1 Tax=unclassified Bacillus (in: firmicutes) TaxID=185979 RepID=UPI000BF56CF1|nr:MULTISPECIES: competence type IV pilus ATPase ComGA [unclassified Bacillus (in: firmicutes)]PFG13874.1 competence protein ComGA [Bacillus sp. es.036]
MLNIEEKGKDIIKQAMEVGASDVHFHPKEKGAAIQFRVDNRLYDALWLPMSVAEKLLSHFKFLSGMDIGEKRRPQNGAMDMILYPRKLHLRLSTIPTPYHESLVIRILPQDETHSFKELFLFPSIANRLLQIVSCNSGLFMITGPTGSGKTTTMYSLLQTLSVKRHRRVLTIEDPIEKRNPDFIQMEVNEKAGLSYYEGFKAGLRHDPDILVVGEIRDEQTAQLAIRASMTGHLVVSTLHTGSTLECIPRLLEFGIPLHNITQTLRGVATQRLVPLKCPYCDVCSLECLKRRTRRKLAVVEILAGLHLQKALDYPELLTIPGQSTIKDYILRAYALGYIQKETVEKELGLFNRETIQMEA